MSAENKAVSRRVIEECFNQGNLAVADELYAADYVDKVCWHVTASLQAKQSPSLKAEIASDFILAMTCTHSTDEPFVLP